MLILGRNLNLFRAVDLGNFQDVAGKLLRGRDIVEDDFVTARDVASAVSELQWMEFSTRASAIASPVRDEASARCCMFRQAIFQ